MAKLLIDGVFFQLASTGIARVWQSLIPLVAEDTAIQIYVLDRGGFPDLANVKRIPFASYHDRYNPDDSILIQKVCNHYGIDVFASTYFTTPLTTPSCLLLHDMIPEVLEFDLAHRHWQEKAVAIAHAQKIITVSDNTRQDLIKYYPSKGDIAISSLSGYDVSVFKPATPDRIFSFKESLGLTRRYMLLVGSREQHRGYKNARLLFDAIAAAGRNDYDVLCMGGEQTVPAEWLDMIPPGITVKRFVGTDQELATAYSGALALVYPSLYEGFGLPVLEAMACACPVITTSRGSLAEVAGDAAIIIDGESISEMVEAIGEVQLESTRAALRAKGLERAAQFTWRTTADNLRKAVVELAKRSHDPDYQAFAARWAQLRRMQAEVDVDCWG